MAQRRELLRDAAAARLEAARLLELAAKAEEDAEIGEHTAPRRDRRSSRDRSRSPRRAPPRRREERGRGRDRSCSLRPCSHRSSPTPARPRREERGDRDRRAAPRLEPRREERGVEQPEPHPGRWADRWDQGNPQQAETWGNRQGERGWSQRTEGAWAGRQPTHVWWNEWGDQTEDQQAWQELTNEGRVVTLHQPRQPAHPPPHLLRAGRQSTQGWPRDQDAGGKGAGKGRKGKAGKGHLQQPVQMPQGPPIQPVRRLPRDRFISRPVAAMFERGGAAPGAPEVVVTDGKAWLSAIAANLGYEPEVVSEVLLRC